MLGAAAPFDLRQHFVYDRIFSERLPEGGIQSHKQIGDRFIVAAHEGNAYFLSHGGQSGAPDGWYLTDRDLTTRVIEEGLDVFEGRSR
jgi:hypothetical protein